MSNEPKGAMHFEGRKSIGAMEAAENQRRWDEKHYQTVNKKPLHWYDITRAHLNFEVAKGGIIKRQEHQNLLRNVSRRGWRNWG